jgi:hypothetical protein
MLSRRTKILCKDSLHSTGMSSPRSHQRRQIIQSRHSTHHNGLNMTFQDIFVPPVHQHIVHPQISQELTLPKLPPNLPKRKAQTTLKVSKSVWRIPRGKFYRQPSRSTVFTMIHGKIMPCLFATVHQVCHLRLSMICLKCKFQVIV